MSRRSQYDQRRQPLLAAMHEAESAHGRSATVRSLAAHVDAGVGTVHAYLQRMRDEGLVDWDEGSVRTLRLTDAGRVAAGSESNLAGVVPGQSASVTPVQPTVNATPVSTRSPADDFVDVGF